MVTLCADIRTNDTRKANRVDPGTNPGSNLQTLNDCDFKVLKECTCNLNMARERKMEKEIQRQRQRDRALISCDVKMLKGRFNSVGTCNLKHICGERERGRERETDTETERWSN